MLEDALVQVAGYTDIERVTAAGDDVNEISSLVHGRYRTAVLLLLRKNILCVVGS